MAITTFDELKTAAANWLDRGDLTDRIPEFIALAEADINSQFNIRTAESEETLVTTQGSRFAPLPTGYREPQALWLQWPSSAGRQSLRFIMPEIMDVSTVASIPTAGGVDGSNIAFNCPISSTTDYTISLSMVGGVALSDAAPTNLILTQYPNVYLFGLLREAAPYLRDADAVSYWTGRYAEALNLAKAKENRAKSLVTLSTEPGELSYGHGRSRFNVYRGW